MTNSEFREIGHCGGTLRINVEVTKDGRLMCGFGISHSSPKPAAFFMIYALPQGIPVATIPNVGMGQAMPQPPVPECYTVFIASDSEGKFGHQCTRCGQYWRSNSAPALWPMTCPYCGLRDATHNFLTEGQLLYVTAFCERTQEAIRAGKSAEIDMDRIADDVANGSERPTFYYAEESQQKRFTCPACGGWNDILGRFGYCSSCGTRNDMAELENAIVTLRKHLNEGGSCVAGVKDAVSAFDTAAKMYVEQLVKRVPMTTARRNRIKDKLFHNLKARSEDIKEVFGVDILEGLKPEDVAFASMMFHRRHVYEHNGGEADEKYITESGDTSVRPKQTIHETKENVHRIASLVTRMAQSLHSGFHDILPPHPTPIKYETDRKEWVKQAQQRNP